MNSQKLLVELAQASKKWVEEKKEITKSTVSIILQLFIESI